MKYPYKVKHDGVWYMPGEEVPDKAAPVVPVAEPEPEKPKKEPAKRKTTTKKK